MTPKESYRELTSHAQMDALKLGLFWVVSMVLFISQFAVPGCGFIWLLCMVFTPFFVARLARSFRDNVRDGELTFGQGYVYCTHVYFCAALILSLVFWAYLHFLDDGYLVNRYISVLTDPQNLEMLGKIGYKDAEIQKMSDYYGQMAASLQGMRPIDLAVELLSFNAVASFILAAFSALLAKTKKRNY